MSNAPYVQVDNYLAISMLSLATYDFLLSFPSEVRLAWKRSITPARVIYFVGRYSIFIWFVVGWLPTLNLSLPSCRARRVLTDISYTLLTIVPAAFGALRVFALTGRSWWVTLPVACLGLVPTFMNIMNYIEVNISKQPWGGAVMYCYTRSLLSARVNIICAVATRASAVTFDLIVVAILWRRCQGSIQDIVHDHREYRFPSITLTLLGDGVICFFVILTLNALDIVLWLTIEFEQLLNTILFPFSCILITRCVLHIWETECALEWSHTQDGPTIIFAHFGTLEEARDSPVQSASTV
ncbi:hypothetical protein DAEQUDRAFT_729198 [Daedalea quercina L-15889]|uniref:DUF6533 domain-containing protein n=1 Tax=Daedalea quercina L-15889 TaxID=1314783 RepID=A0A165NT68_9APHY|nr:hypothetical protein DAEQUDRAFT_729198 [Daedalea quercina L-15889]